MTNYTKDKPGIDVHDLLDSKNPHGACECNKCIHCSCISGPAAYKITRNNKSIKVCTKCILSTDNNKTCLVKKTDDPKPYLDFDYLGAIVMAAEIDGEVTHTWY